jgi:hypothetical protein
VRHHEVSREPTPTCDRAAVRRTVYMKRRHYRRPPLLSSPRALCSRPVYQLTYTCVRPPRDEVRRAMSPHSFDRINECMESSRTPPHPPSSLLTTLLMHRPSPRLLSHIYRTAALCATTLSLSLSSLSFSRSSLRRCSSLRLHTHTHWLCIHRSHPTRIRAHVQRCAVQRSAVEAKRWRCRKVHDMMYESHVHSVLKKESI